jgi:hypothetical protein
MFIGGMLVGVGTVGAVWAAVAGSRREKALEKRLQAIEAVCFKSET